MKFPKKWHFCPVFMACLASLLIVPSCKDRGGVERTRDANGVETVLNPIDPVKVNGRQVTLELEEEIVIDTENDVVAKTGLSGIAAFAADSKGNIYILSSKADPGFILQFDAKGRFLRSFGRQGQGPGEMQSPVPFSFETTTDGTLAVVDRRNPGLHVYGQNGIVIKERTLEFGQEGVIPLPGGNHLMISLIFDPKPDADNMSEQKAGLCGPALDEIRELDRAVTLENFMMAAKFKAAYRQFSWAVSDKFIATGFSERDYEIKIFDHKARFIRTVKKKYSPQRVPKAYKSDFLKQFESAMFDEFRKKIYFPETMPPYDYIFGDETGRIYVMTCEPGKKEDERRVDIFDSEGVFIAETTLPTRPGWLPAEVRAKAKNGRLYCLREKANGYQELVVYRMNWRG